MNTAIKRPTLGLPKPAAPEKQLTIGDLIVEIRWRQRQIEQAKERIIKSVLVRPGDEVEINDGGSLGKKMVVVTTAVEEHPETGGMQFVAIGIALNSAGEPGSRRGIHRILLPAE